DPAVSRRATQAPAGPEVCCPVITRFGPFDMRALAEVHCGWRADTPMGLQWMPPALWGTISSMLPHLFAAERLSPSAPERVPRNSPSLCGTKFAIETASEQQLRTGRRPFRQSRTGHPA